MNKNLKIIKKAVVFVTALSLLLAVCLSASADSVADDNMLNTTANRFDYIQISTYNGDYIITTDSRIGAFPSDYSQNQYLEIIYSKDGNISYETIDTWVTTYPTSETYIGSIIRQGFISTWLKSLGRINHITVHYDKMYYTLAEGKGDGLAIRYQGSFKATDAIVQMSGNIVTHNWTTGENVYTPFTKNETIRNVKQTAQAYEFWNSNSIRNYLDYTPSSNSYLLDDVKITIVCNNDLNNFSIFGSLETQKSRQDRIDAVDRELNSGVDDLDFSWLLGSVQAFLAFELVPGLKLYTILIAISGLSIFTFFMKMFSGG